MPPKVKVIAGFCIYREAATIRSAVESVAKYADEVVVWDGRFDLAPEIPEDGTEKITKEAMKGIKKFHYVKTKPMPQVQKRDLMLRYCAEGDLLLIMDGEEVAVGDVKAGLQFARDHPEKKVFWIWFNSDDQTKNLSAYRPRIYRVEKGMHYSLRHDWIFRADGTMVVDWKKHPDAIFDEQFCDSAENAIVRQFNLINLGNLRNPVVNAVREEYRKKLAVRGGLDNEPSQIVAGYMVYRDAGVIARSLAPIAPYVDGVIVANGLLPHSYPLPEDGTLSMIEKTMKRFGRKVVVDSTPGVEFEMRTTILKHVKDGDRLLMIDADEILQGDVGSMFRAIREHPEIEVFWIKVHEFYFDKTEQTPWKAKVFKVHAGDHFYPNHWTYRNAKDQVVSNATVDDRPIYMKLDMVKIENLGDRRPPEYAERRKKLYHLLDGMDVHNDPKYEVKLKEGVRPPPPAPKPQPLIAVPTNCPFCGGGWPKANADGTYTCEGAPKHRFSVQLVASSAKFG